MKKAESVLGDGTVVSKSNMYPNPQNVYAVYVLFTTEKHHLYLRKDDGASGYYTVKNVGTVRSTRSPKSLERIATRALKIYLKNQYKLEQSKRTSVVGKKFYG